MLSGVLGALLSRHFRVQFHKIHLPIFHSGPDSIYLQDVPPIPHFNLSRRKLEAEAE